MRKHNKFREKNQPKTDQLTTMTTINNDKETKKIKKGDNKKKH